MGFLNLRPCYLFPVTEKEKKCSNVEFFVPSSVSKFYFDVWARSKGIIVTTTNKTKQHQQTTTIT